MTNNKLQITVLDMQPITPMLGGGRIRLAGLYHNFPQQAEVTYIGSYDWRGEKKKDQMNSDNLREICIPLSHAHFKQNEQLSEQAGFNCIDLMFNQLGFLSHDYIQTIKQQVYHSDIIIFSHPWVYPLVKDIINEEQQMIVYDSQNHEGLLRYELYHKIQQPLAQQVLTNVAAIEYDLCRKSHLILSCSDEDIQHFIKLYQIAPKKLKLVPNGVFFKTINQHQKAPSNKPKKAIFMGSNYAPNVETVQFILTEIAPQLAHIEFIIAGGVCNAFKKNRQKNVTLLGYFDEQDKSRILSSADIALNPMFSGSGTNIKMFDFMAASLPIIVTPIGARGIIKHSIPGIIVAQKHEFLDALKQWDFTQSVHTDKIARQNFDFAAISKNLGKYLSLTQQKNKKQTIFMLTSWNIACGIADHSRQLAEQFWQQHNISIIANDNHYLYAAEMTKDIKYTNVYKAWHYDNIHYQNSSVDIDSIVAITKNSHALFIIHYHPAFFSVKILVQLLQAIKKQVTTLVLTLHNANIDDQTLLDYLAHNKQIKVVTHNLQDSHYLNTKNIKADTFFLGIPDSKANTENKQTQDNTFIVGGFGFLRKHKGILNTIKAIHSLTQNNKNSEYRGLHTLIADSTESQHLLKECNDYIKQHQLEKTIKLTTDYLPTQNIIDQLSACDIIVLAYDDSDEGSSAAASMAFSAGIPVCVTDTHIFNHVKPYACVIEDNKKQSLCDTINTLNNNPEIYRHYLQQSKDYQAQYSINKTAENYLKLTRDNHNEIPIQ